MVKRNDARHIVFSDLLPMNVRDNHILNGRTLDLKSTVASDYLNAFGCVSTIPSSKSNIY